MMHARILLVGVFAMNALAGGQKSSSPSDNPGGYARTCWMA